MDLRFLGERGGGGGLEGTGGSTTTEAGRLGSEWLLDRVFLGEFSWGCGWGEGEEEEMVLGGGEEDEARKVGGGEAEEEGGE